MTSCAKSAGFSGFGALNQQQRLSHSAFMRCNIAGRKPPESQAGMARDFIRIAQWGMWLAILIAMR
jgi:hypothetical protein